MRNNQPVTQRERTFPAQQRLISTTDAKGVITYCNDAFVEISGFTREELLRAPHNLVRHPDVPGAVFAHMWTTLKQGLPWMGIVKNRCKTGDHYWVNAYVTPVFEGNQVVGYESVRIKPTAEQIRRAARHHSVCSTSVYAWVKAVALHWRCRWCAPIRGRPPGCLRKPASHRR